jgi:hypothetical protein
MIHRSHPSLSPCATVDGSFKTATSDPKRGSQGLRADTGGAFSVVEHLIEPGRLVLPRLHVHEDEQSGVLEGMTVGDHEVAAGPGS